MVDGHPTLKEINDGAPMQCSTLHFAGDGELLRGIPGTAQTMKRRGTEILVQANVGRRYLKN